MAVKRKMIECECGEVFVDGKGVLDGNVSYGPWCLKGSKQRSTKSKSGGDILVVAFERSVVCNNCKSELMREKRQYEVTPPGNVSKPEPIPSYGTRDLMVRSDSSIGTEDSESIPENIVKLGTGT